MLEVVLDYLKQNQTRFIAELCELLRFSQRLRAATAQSRPARLRRMAGEPLPPDRTGSQNRATGGRTSGGRRRNAAPQKF